MLLFRLYSAIYGALIANASIEESTTTAVIQLPINDLVARDASLLSKVNADGANPCSQACKFIPDRACFKIWHII